MEFICNRCGLTCRGVPAGAIQLYPICEDCFNELHNELMEDKGMNKSTYEVNGICNRCSEYTLIDVETRLCEDCSESELTFIDAIQKYGMITNDGGETVYTTNKEGTIVMKTKGTGKIFNVTVDLLTSTGWEEYKDKELKLPTFICEANEYYTISEIDEVYAYIQRSDSIDAGKLKVYKYFTDKWFAQYVADKQFIQRIELTLTELNKDKFPKEELTKLINKYLRDNHMEVLDRIIRYEL